MSRPDLEFADRHEHSRPVRIGNAASTQLQLDVYGEIMDVLHRARECKLAASEAGWQLQLALMAHLEDVWNQPDRGMWEVRGRSQHFTRRRASGKRQHSARRPGFRR